MSTDTRPILAVITGHLTPYRHHINLRLARELTGMRLRTLVTKNASTMWRAREMPEIGTVLFDTSERDWESASWPEHLRHERRKGRELTAWLEQHRPAAVISAGYDEIPNLMAVQWCRRNRVPVFLAADSNIRSDVSSGLKRLTKRVVIPRVLRRFTGILACGRLGRAFFEYYGARPERIFYAPLEPDYALFESITPEEVAAACGRHGLDRSRRRLVMCGRLVALKRTDQVIDAFARLGDERPEWDLIIIGDGPERAALEARVPVALRQRVRFLGQIGDMREIAAVYRASDALVLASMHDAWALVINEAVASGLAIVGSNVIGAVPELVEEGVNGRTFPPGDLGALTEAMRDVTDPLRIDAMKAASPAMLAKWRAKADPVGGVREALAAAGVRSG